MKIYNLLFLALALISSDSFPYEDKNITIFIHGTRRLSKLFIKYTNQDNKIVNIKEIPSSCITHSIFNALSKKDSPIFSNNYFFVFGWSGKLSHKARLAAAKILYTEINNLIAKLKKENINPNINLITHSHGGNVALNLANCIHDNNLNFQINNLILLACPVQEQTCKLINHNLFKNIYNIYSTLDLMQVLDPQGLHPENKNKKTSFFSKRRFDYCCKLKQAKIKINSCGVTHTGFLSQKLFKRLPDLLNKMDKLTVDSGYLVKI